MSGVFLLVLFPSGLYPASFPQVRLLMDVSKLLKSLDASKVQASRCDHIDSAAIDYDGDYSSQSNGKRKNLHDFFRPVTKSRKVSMGSAASSSSHTIKSSGGTPPGLSILPSFVSIEEERELLGFLDAESWRTDLARRVIHYGGTYCLMPPRNASPETRTKTEATILEAAPIPAALAFVIERMVERGLYDANDRPAYCIVNEYKPGQGISAHVENFRFGEPVCSLTLAGADSMRFHELETVHDGSVRSGQAAKAPRTGRRIDLSLERRSLVVLTGDSRSKWQHEIVRGRKSGKSSTWRRVSLTFRVEKMQRGRSNQPV